MENKEITSLSDHKNKKLAKRLVSDIDAILKVLSLTQRGLAHFKQYIPVQEIISTIQTNVTLLEVHRNKYAKALEDATKEHT